MLWFCSRSVASALQKEWKKERQYTCTTCAGSQWIFPPPPQFNRLCAAGDSDPLSKTIKHIQDCALLVSYTRCKIQSNAGCLFARAVLSCTLTPRWPCVAQHCRRYILSAARPGARRGKAAGGEVKVKEDDLIYCEAVLKLS